MNVAQDRVNRLCNWLLKLNAQPHYTLLYSLDSLQVEASFNFLRIGHLECSDKKVCPSVCHVAGRGHRVGRIAR